ncbi:MAG: superoxide dismutase [Flavipsychrobacter sp.]
MAHLFPALKYAFDALEPHIDAFTMETHYYKHHQTTVDNLNKALAGTDGETLSLQELLANVSKYPAARNSAGSHYNHSQYWEILSPDGGGEPIGALAESINTCFGSFNAMKEKMNAAGLARFGSGWAWLIVKDGKLDVCSTPNQDNPLMDIAEVKGIPILGIDVWEHAYYIKYQNRRPDYLHAIWNVIDWNVVAGKFEAAVQ